MLRGPRVDHPFRSFRPRYTMTLTHPLVRQHYADMMRALLQEVPDLGYIAVWSNDSGSGFEHTKSLYVGRNGGPYMIREWKDDADDRPDGRVARPQVPGVCCGMQRARSIRTSGSSRVSSRSTASTRPCGAASGTASRWRRRRSSPAAGRCPTGTPGTRTPARSTAARSTSWTSRRGRRELGAELTARGATAHYYFSAGPHQMFAPLMGVPVSAADLAAAAPAAQQRRHVPVRRRAAPARPNLRRSTSTTRSCGACSSTRASTSTARSRRLPRRGPVPEFAPALRAGLGRRRRGHPRVPRTRARSTPPSGSPGIACGSGRSCRTSRRFRRPNGRTTKTSCARRRTTRTTWTSAVTCSSS